MVGPCSMFVLNQCEKRDGMAVWAEKPVWSESKKNIIGLLK